MVGHLSKVRDDRAVRTFIAVDLSASVRERLASFERDFSRHRPILKWVAPSLLHLTVKFLGGVDHARLASVEEATRRAASEVRPFDLRLATLGAFPNVRVPRVVWVGLNADGGLDALRSFFSHLERALGTAGFPPEDRPFSPHITLARVREGADALRRQDLGRTLAQIQQVGQIDGSIPVRDVIVMRSDSGPAGPIYTPLCRAPLGGSTKTDRLERNG